MEIFEKIRRVRALKNIWRFFQKTPEPRAFRANKKGKGFHLLKRPRKDKEIIELRKRLITGGGITAIGVVLLLLIVGQHSTPEFTVLVATMMTLCGLIAYDIIGRRFWEKKLTLKINELCANHDRAVREVARNRSDIGILKEGLGDMALNVEAQGRDLPPSSSVEAQMIETMVYQLGAIGDKPRSDLETKYDSDILELEMAPPPSNPPPLSDLDTALSPDFSKYSDAVVSELVNHAVRNDKIDLFMQPVVNLPQRKTRMHEVFSRIRAGGGTYLPAERYMDMAYKEQLTSSLDNLLLLRALKILRERDGNDNTPYIINISAAALNDRAFMSDLVAFLSKNHKMAGRLIFELSQKEFDERNESIEPLLGGLSQLGCRFSMDRVRNRKIDIKSLKSRHIRFIKLDANWLLSEAHSKTGFSRIVRMKKQLDAAGIDLIVEKIESENMLRELLDFNIDYGQGYLFGKPDHHAAYREEKAA